MWYWQLIPCGLPTADTAQHRRVEQLVRTTGGLKDRPHVEACAPRNQEQVMDACSRNTYRKIFKRQMLLNSSTAQLRGERETGNKTGG
jgi:hypothetical protein